MPDTETAGPLVTTPSGEPITDLTPAEQAEVNQLYQAQQQPTAPAEPVPKLLNPYVTPQYADAEGKSISLTAAEGAEYRKKAGLVDPLRDLSPEDMVSLQRSTADNLPDKKFDIFSAWNARRQEIQTDPQAEIRVAAAWRQYKDSTNLGDIANPLRMAKNAASGVSDLVTSTAKMGQKVALTGLINQGGTIFSKVARTNPSPGSSLTGAAGLPETAPAQTPQDDVLALWHDATQADNLQATIKGEGGEWLPKFQKSLDIIKANGLSLRPEEIQKYASGSPLTYYLVGKLFGLAEMGTPTAMLDAAGNKLASGVSKGLTAAAQGAAEVAPVIAKVAPLVGAVKGTALGGIPGGITGWAVGKKAQETLLGAAPKAAKLAEAAQELAGATEIPITSSYTQLARSILQNIPHAAYQTGKGYLFDLAMGMTGETPEDAKSVGIGTLFGLIGAGHALGVPALSGLLIGPRGYGKAEAPARTGFYPGLDDVHQNALD